MPDPRVRVEPSATVASVAAFFRVVAELGVPLSMVKGSQELSGQSSWFVSAPAMYWALKEYAPAARFRCDGEALPGATPAWVVDAPVQSVVVKNLNVTVPLSGKPPAFPIDAVS